MVLLQSTPLSFSHFNANTLLYIKRNKHIKHTKKDAQKVISSPKNVNINSLLFLNPSTLSSTGYESENSA